VAITLVRISRPLPLIAWIVAGLFALAFLILVVLHAILVTKITALERRVALFDRGLQRIAGDFAKFPERGDRFLVAGHPYLGDLDIFGPASLFQLVSTAETGAGERRLATWLSEPAAADEIAARQAAVRELATMRAFREELAVDGAESGAKGRDAEPLLDWAEGRVRVVFGSKKAGLSPRIEHADAALDPGGTMAAPPPLSSALFGASAVLVSITIALFIAGRVLGAEHLGVARHLWAVSLLAQLVVLGLSRPAIEPILSVVASQESPFGRYVPLLCRIEGQEFTSSRLIALRARLTGSSGADASSAVASLLRIVSFAELRHSGLMHVIANLFFLWDVFCARALAGWRERFGRTAQMRSWLDALAEIEALASLASFADEHPGFAYPSVDSGPPHFDAEALGHPLIVGNRRVENDVDVGAAGHALLITGSNMSGKSTLLRSMGVSAVLALAGAPVCAKRLSMASCSVRTSMRIKDSLEEGVSHFYAELARLKSVVDAVNAGEKVFFLLDEVLHGTNSRERQIGAKAIVKHLLAHQAVGAVSSHDLGLADLEAESGGKVVNVHFEESVEDGKMTFDYHLKPGVVTTANALRLMKVIGIDVELPVELPDGPSKLEG
jgi:MutS-like protein